MYNVYAREEIKQNYIKSSIKTRESKEINEEIRNKEQT